MIKIFNFNDRNIYSLIIIVIPYITGIKSILQTRNVLFIMIHIGEMVQIEVIS